MVTSIEAVIEEIANRIEMASSNAGIRDMKAEMLYRASVIIVEWACRYRVLIWRK